MPVALHLSRRRLSIGLMAGAVSVIAAMPAAGQVPPSPAEVAAYRGLHRAAWQGSVAGIATALRAGAAVDGRDGRGRTALHVATHAARHDAIRALVAAGARLDLLDDDRYDAVIIAAVADDEATLALLLALGAPAGLTTSRYDGTALIAAAHLGHDGVVRRLIAAGAPVDHVNNLHWTALIEAVVLGDGGPRHIRTVEALLAAGADRTRTDRAGRTPLALARARGFDAIAQRLADDRSR